MTRTYLEKKTEKGVTSMGAFEALLELLNVYPQLPGGVPWAVRTTFLGCKVFTRSEAVPVLRLMVASSSRCPPWSSRCTREE